MTQVTVPDIGEFTDVPVIEILVAEGEAVELDAPLVTLESDKATMEIPAPVAGVVDKLLVKLGDKVSEGTPIATIAAGNGAPAGEPQLDAAPAAPDVAPESPEVDEAVPPPPPPPAPEPPGGSRARPPPAAAPRARACIRTIGASRRARAGARSGPARAGHGRRR